MPNQVGALRRDYIVEKWAPIWKIEQMMPIGLMEIVKDKSNSIRSIYAWSNFNCLVLKFGLSIYKNQRWAVIFNQMWALLMDLKQCA